MILGTRLIWVLGVILIGFGAYPVDAATGREIAMRSGEHPAFSRIVVEMGDPVPWTLAKQGNGYAIGFDAVDLRFLTEDIFKKLSTRRIGAIEQAQSERGSVLSIETRCPCHVSAFEITPGRLVIDIIDGALDESALPAEPFPPAASAQGPLTTINAPKPAQSSVLQPPSQRPERNAAVVLPPDLPEPPKRAAHSPAASPLFSSKDVQVAAAQARLIAQLGRAMSQGAIDPITPDLRRPETAQPEAMVGEPSLAETPTRTAEKGPTQPPGYDDVAANPFAHLNLTARSVFDRDQFNLPTSGLEELDPACIPPNDLDIADWASTKNVAAEFASLRTGLVGELDRVDQAKLDRLLKLLIVNGFGAEASAMLSTYKGLVRNSGLLGELANLFETGEASKNGVLSAQIGCPGPAALWGLVAQEKIPLGFTPNFADIAGYFTNLPKEIRRVIGPVLGTKYLEAGFVKAAQDIANLVSRAPGDHGFAFALFEARLKMAMGNRSEARDKLTALVQSNQPESSQALKSLLELIFEAGGEVPKDLITETGARAFELRFSPLGETLALMEVQALALSQDQDAAFEVLDHERSLGAISETNRNRAAAGIFQSFDWTRQTPAKLTRTYYKHAKELTDSADMDMARRQLARAFFNIGLPDIARDIFLGLANRTTAEDRHMIARSYLLSGLPQKANEVLAADRSADGIKIRARAFADLGDFDLAYDLIKGIPDDVETQVLAWQANRMSDISDNSDHLRQQAAQYVTQDQDSPVDTQGSAPLNEGIDFAAKLRAPTELSLQSMDRLLSQSQASRAFVQSLLEANPIQPKPEK